MYGALPLSASLDISTAGINEAAVTIKGEELTVSQMLKNVADSGYSDRVAYLYLWANTKLTIDESLTLNRGGEVKESAEFIYQTYGRCLTIGGNGQQFIWGSSSSLTITYDPVVSPTEEIQWLILDATSGKSCSVDYRNNTPLIFNSTAAGLKNVGVVYSADEIGLGEIGLVIGGSVGRIVNPSFTTLTIVAKPIPEPGTATLCLIALATLTFRRRRGRV